MSKKRQDKKVKAVIFDMDGLLFDTEILYIKVWEHVLASRDLPITIADVKKTLGLNREQSLRFYVKLLKDVHLIEEIRTLRAQLFQEVLAKEGIKCKPGVLEVLDYCKNNQIKTALATSTSQIDALQTIAQAGLDYDFDIMIFGDMVSKSKPDPEIFNRAADLLDIDKQYCVVCEDSYNGVLAANRAQIDVVWVEDLVDLRNNPDIFYDFAPKQLDEMIEYYWGE